MHCQYNHQCIRKGIKGKPCTFLLLAFHRENTWRKRYARSTEHFSSPLWDMYNLNYNSISSTLPLSCWDLMWNITDHLQSRFSPSKANITKLVRNIMRMFAYQSSKCIPMHTSVRFTIREESLSTWVSHFKPAMSDKKCTILNILYCFTRRYFHTLITKLFNYMIIWSFHKIAKRKEL